MVTLPKGRKESKAQLDFIILNEHSESITCSFKKLFEYGETLYVAFEDPSQEIHILKIKDPYTLTPKLVELSNDNKKTIYNHYKSLIGERIPFLDEQ
ncbi:hypothetical protein GCM10010916_39280 [Paenibacillus abyssi]|uniref:Uncharacterized protein n=1 Tax=Paenibacillus abyssi TaxID=1340531 RepID=A0A917G2H7_9BACL|nr:hypothetical protein GCM10010916_39280 [Paenibacillus abyssi]